MFLTKIFFKKSPVAETFITCWKIINTLVYISHFTITEIIFHWLWPHIFITGEKPSELNNKWTILIAGNGDNLESICYSGESSHGMVKHHKHHHHHKQSGIFKHTHIGIIMYKSSVGLSFKILKNSQNIYLATRTDSKRVCKIAQTEQLKWWKS